MTAPAGHEQRLRWAGPDCLPVAFAIAGLLDSVGIVVGIEASLGKVTRKVLFRKSGTIGEANVVTVIQFVRTSHYKKALSASERGRVQSLRSEY